MDLDTCLKNVINEFCLYKNDIERIVAKFPPSKPICIRLPFDIVHFINWGETPHNIVVYNSMNGPPIYSELITDFLKKAIQYLSHYH